MNEDEYRKSPFLSGIRKILNSSTLAIEIIRKNRMMSLKTLERSSRCTKDPNPLSTAMHVIGTKFPLSIDKKAIKKFEIPESFFPTTEGSKMDYIPPFWQSVGKKRTDRLVGKPSCCSKPTIGQGDRNRNQAGKARSRLILRDSLEGHFYQMGDTCDEQAGREDKGTQRINTGITEKNSPL